MLKRVLPFVLVSLDGLRPDGASNRINLAAIGVGNRGAANAWQDYVTTQDDVRLVAACDCFASRRSAFAAKVDAFYGGKYCEPMADWRDVLARADIATASGGVIGSRARTTGTSRWPTTPRRRRRTSTSRSPWASPWPGPSSSARPSPRTRSCSSTAPSSAPRASSRGPCELVRNGHVGKIRHVDAWCSGMRSPGNYAQVFEERFHDTETAPVPAGSSTTRPGSVPRP